MNLDNVATGIGTALRKIPRLNVHDEIPAKITPPCAFIALGEIRYDEDFGGGMAVDWQIPVLISKANVRGAQKKIREFCAPNAEQSTNSIKAAVELENTLDGEVGSIIVKGTDEPERVEIAGQEYVQVVFHAEAID